MTTHLDDGLQEVQDRFGRFAAAEIAGRGFPEFPLDVWRKMGKAGLLGIGLPEAWGGRGGGSLAILLAGEALVRRGHSLGLALSWMIHVIVARYIIAPFADPAQQERYLPALASGEKTACLAISEPGGGAHPKHLKTRGEYREDRWVLTGEKTLLTNGPFADLFVVLAVTGMAGSEKRFTAFLVPADTPGLTRTAPLPLTVLQPSPHCGIRLESCSLPSSHILGTEGSAYRQISTPFREIEDLLLMGPVLGGMDRQLALLLQAFRTEAIQPTAEQKTELGWIQALIPALQTLAGEAAVQMDAVPPREAFPSLLLAAKALAEQHQERVRLLLSAVGLRVSPELETLTGDLRFSVQLAKKVSQIKAMKQGEALLERKEP